MKKAQRIVVFAFSFFSFSVAIAGANDDRSQMQRNPILKNKILNQIQAEEAFEGELSVQEMKQHLSRRIEYLQRKLVLESDLETLEEIAQRIKEIRSLLDSHLDNLN